MFNSLTVEREEAKLVEDKLLHELLHPPIEAPPKRRPPLLVRWLEWLVVLAVVAGAVAVGVIILRGDADTEIRHDLLATRYRETGVAIPAPVEPLYDGWMATLPSAEVAEIAHLQALRELYLAQVAGPELPWQARMITTAVPLPQPSIDPLPGLLLVAPDLPVPAAASIDPLPGLLLVAPDLPVPAAASIEPLPGLLLVAPDLPAATPAPWQAQMITTAVPLPGAVVVPRSVYTSAAPTLVPAMATAVAALTPQAEAYVARSIAPAEPTPWQESMITPAAPGPFPDLGEYVRPVPGRHGGPL
jgi:hypothetical protein